MCLVLAVLLRFCSQLGFRIKYDDEGLDLLNNFVQDRMIRSVEHSWNFHGSILVCQLFIL